jgi:2-dehydropantoate 2-reductase
MRIIIYGAGAIGGTLGSRLHFAGFEVLLIARGAHGEAINATGLLYRNPESAMTQQIPCVSHPDAITFRPDDAVLLTVKSQDTLQALTDLARVAPPSIRVFCAQNGVHNEALALRFFSQVYGMLVLCPGTHLTPGEVIHSAANPGGLFDTGCYPRGIDDDAEAMAAALTQAGFSAKADPNIMALKYAKLLQNLGNPLQLLLSDFDQARHIMRVLTNEALSCFAAAGIECTDAAASRARFSVVRPAEVTNAPRGGSSTWQSVARGQQHIETPFLNGEICQLGRLFQTPTPGNQLLLTLSLAVAAAPKDFKTRSSTDLLQQLSAGSVRAG